MSKLKGIWRDRANARHKEPEDLKPINLFTCSGWDQLLQIAGMVGIAPREVSRDAPGALSRNPQKSLRMRVIARALKLLGTMDDPPDSLQMNSIAVALGTFRDDPKQTMDSTYDVMPETNEEFRRRLQGICEGWMAEHGMPSHQCQECIK